MLHLYIVQLFSLIFSLLQNIDKMITLVPYLHYVQFLLLFVLRCHSTNLMLNQIILHMCLEVGSQLKKVAFNATVDSL